MAVIAESKGSNVPHTRGDEPPVVNLVFIIK